MVDPGASSSGTAAGDRNLQRDEDKSYYGDLVDRFTEKYIDRRARTGHAPQQTKDQYEATLWKSQTSVCTRLAALKYQTDTDTVLEGVTGVDSHMFECSWVAQDDTRLCFHVCFSARVSDVKRFFFAELIGTNSPQFVTSCVMFDGNTPFTVRNCKFCSGLWHPVDGDFLGKE